MPEELPNGWIKTALGEIAEPSRERALPTDFPDMPYLGLEHIAPQSMRLIEHGYGREVRSSSVRFSKGDVLYGRMRPYLNKVWVADFDGLCSAEYLVFPKREGVNDRFLALRLNAEDFVSFANGQVSGERPRVHFEKLRRFPILLPPTAEQERIAAKLSAALSRLERADTAARRACERLQRYRSAVCHAAVTGELTRAWRTAHRKIQKNDDTGESLLRRLLAVRWGDDSKSHHREPAPPGTTDLPELPDTWVWASLEMVAEIGSGISVSQNRFVKNPVELPYLRVANVLRGRLDLSEIKTIRVEKDRVPDYLLRIGDVLFTEGGDRDKLGRGWIWEGQIQNCAHQNHVFRARLADHSLLNPKLVSQWGNTFGQQFFLTNATQTTNLASISRSVLGRLPVPIAPLEEQAEIIRQLDERIAATDRLSAKLDRQFERARATRQSLFFEAFHGRLVSQNPTDQPASMLLESIRISRKTETQKVKAKRMPKPKSKMKTSGLRNLLEVLKEYGGSMTPEELFLASGHSQDSVDHFFAELRELTTTPAKIAEERKVGGITLLKVVP